MIVIDTYAPNIMKLPVAPLTSTIAAPSGSSVNTLVIQLNPTSTALPDNLGLPDSPSKPLDIATEGLDLEADDSLHIHPGSLSLLEGSKAYLELVTRMATALNIQFSSDIPMVTDFIHSTIGPSTSILIPHASGSYRYSLGGKG
ncbi:UNVERIFIED_CONTAM: hypothetical protein K2H54_003452 [Gekko kuhli]